LPKGDLKKGDSQEQKGLSELDVKEIKTITTEDRKL